MSAFSFYGMLAVILGVGLQAGRADAQVACSDAAEPRATTGAILIVTNGPFRAADLAVQGPGWFVLRDPETDREFLTRHLSFDPGNAGFLTGPYGLRLQGYCDSTLSNRGDLQVIVPFEPFWFRATRTFDIGPDGKIRISLFDGTQLVTGQILLRSFASPANLARVAPNLFAATPAAQLIHQWVEPGTDGVGTTFQGTWEPIPEDVRISFQPNAQRAGIMAEGSLVLTGVPSELGIQGPGCFLVRRTNDSELFATRAGLFLVDGEGYLVTYDRMLVQGYSDCSFSTVGDVRVDNVGAPSDAEVDMYWIEGDGQLIVRLSDRTAFVRGKLCLFDWRHPELLVPTNNSLYANAAAAEPKLSMLKRGTVGDGIRQGYIERVHLTDELLAKRRTFSLFPRGGIRRNESPAHLAIFGPGFFILRNPTNGADAVTRWGAFTLDDAGYLITSNGFRVQGFCDPQLSVRGDIRINEDGRPIESTNATIDGFYFAYDGRLKVRLSDGVEFTRGQILLQSFREPFALVASEGGAFTNQAAADPASAPSAPVTAGLGEIYGAALDCPVEPENLNVLPRDGARLRITGEGGDTWAIEATTDFHQWELLGIVKDSYGDTEFVDPGSVNHAARFYRVSVKNR